jgi:hypothetical protein
VTIRTLGALNGSRDFRLNKMIEATRCQCGAISVEDTEAGVTNHMKRTTFRKLFPGMLTKRGKEWYSCDHCVNQWGIDICACGSGMDPKKCDGGFRECGRPYETMGVRVLSGVAAIAARGGW